MIYPFMLSAYFDILEAKSSTRQLAEQTIIYLHNQSEKLPRKKKKALRKKIAVLIRITGILD